jgi:hypothetical protein
LDALKGLEAAIKYIVWYQEQYYGTMQQS